MVHFQWIFPKGLKIGHFHVDLNFNLGNFQLKLHHPLQTTTRSIPMRITSLLLPCADFPLRHVLKVALKLSEEELEKKNSIYCNKKLLLLKKVMWKNAEGFSFRDGNLKRKILMIFQGFFGRGQWTFDWQTDVCRLSRKVLSMFLFIFASMKIEGKNEFSTFGCVKNSFLPRKLFFIFRRRKLFFTINFWILRRI